MIEVIWPLSTLPCNRDTVLGGKNLIGLRTFVQEVLRRSKTSYSTLQVALYYLVLVKPYIPGQDFTMEQSEDSQSCRAMQCGRRMFLAALILASKYLQDRNYSARAWSKISGLKTFEINTNEMAFLSAVNWKLHIPEPLFQRWTDVVLKYSPSAPPPGSPRSSPGSPSIWKLVVPTLTPELDTLQFGSVTLQDCEYSPSTIPSVSPVLAASLSPPCSSSNEQTLTPTSTIPRFLEPNPQEYTQTSRCGSTRLPPLPQLGFLPTPQMTPQSSTFSTPAVGAPGLCFGKSSMSAAMARVQTACAARTTLDFWKPTIPETFPPVSRRPSLAYTASSLSSPESMISDVSNRSSRSSRSSSISSVASSACALPLPRLAVQATRRCANMQLSGIKKNIQPIVPSPHQLYTSDTRDSYARLDPHSVSPPEPRRVSPQQSPAPMAGPSYPAFRSRQDADGMSWEAFNSSPESYSHHGQEYAKAFLQSQQCAMAKYRDTSDQEAAEGLRDLALNRPRITSLHPNPQTRSRKRERPGSIDVSLQQNVRQLIAPRSLADITNNKKSIPRNEDDGTVLTDKIPADSFVLRENFKLPDLMLSNVRLPLAKDGSARKRACCAAEQAGSLTMLATAQRGTLPGPGMWEGVL